MSVVYLGDGDPNNGHFTPDECGAVCELAVAQGGVAGEIEESYGSIDAQARSVTRYALEWDAESDWVFRRIATVARIANDVYFGFDIPGLYSEFKIRSVLHDVNVLHYSVGDHYVQHMDYGPVASTRKLSVSSLLTGPGEYDGGELVVEVGNREPEITNNELGAHVIFPSFLLHEVRPITRGERWALVAWIEGPPFR